jgi:hypothetical protein
MIGKIKIKTSLIAPCGMNCGVCSGYQRTKNKCSGCNSFGLEKPNYCRSCSIKFCKQRTGSKSKFCFACEQYPCKRLKNLDKRYKTKYGMSMLENLGTIKNIGIRKFVNSEKERWTCPSCGNIICVHKPACLVCGTKRVICCYSK